VSRLATKAVCTTAGINAAKRGAEELIWGCFSLSLEYFVPAQPAMCTPVVATASPKLQLSEPPRNSRGNPRIRGEFKLTLALLVGVWLFIAGFVLVALWLKWRL
jgi:hypothetical protein